MCRPGLVLLLLACAHPRGEITAVPDDTATVDAVAIPYDARDDVREDTNADAVTMLDARPMLGSFATPRDGCSALVAMYKSFGEVAVCVAAPPSPLHDPRFSSLAILRVTITTPPPFRPRYLHAALELASRGWFVASDGILGEDGAGMHKRWFSDLRFDEATIHGAHVHVSAIDAREIIATDPSTGKASPRGPFGFQAHLQICGVLPSGTPACIEPIPTFFPTFPAPHPGRALALSVEATGTLPL